MKEEILARYKATTQYLEHLSTIPHPRKISRPEKLKRTEEFMQLLDDPHRGFEYVHVGGTSGKGSVAAMMHSILTNSGYTTGLYTSPYTTTPIDKISVNNLYIDAESFIRIVDQIKPIIESMLRKSNYGHPSWFEIYFAIASLYFREQHCTHVVLEVGCGGRYDQTNIIDTPAVTIINLVGRDHEHLLGNNMRDIANEKAGIIKPGTVFFTPDTNTKSVLKLFTNTCKKFSILCHVVKTPAKPFALQLIGDHQQHNAALAQAAAQQLGVSSKDILEGLKNTVIPARFEIVSRHPLIIVDSAHNESKIKTTLDTLSKFRYNKLYSIIGLSGQRNPRKLFKTLSSVADTIYITTAGTIHKAIEPLQIATQLNPPANICSVYNDPFEALNIALQQAQPDDCILITGSLYLAGTLRTHWRSEQTILQERKR